VTQSLTLTLSFFFVAFEGGTWGACFDGDAHRAREQHTGHPRPPHLTTRGTSTDDDVSDATVGNTAGRQDRDPGDASDRRVGLVLRDDAARRVGDDAGAAGRWSWCGPGGIGGDDDGGFGQCQSWRASFGEARVDGDDGADEERTDGGDLERAKGGAGEGPHCVGQKPADFRKAEYGRYSGRLTNLLEPEGHL